MLSAPVRARVAALLDDPHVASWAIARLVDLERSGRLAERDEALEVWFSDPAALGRALEVAAPWSVADLLEMVPAERFAPVADRLAELWPGWRDQVAYRGAAILAAISPELAARVFAERLEDAGVPPSMADRSAALAVLGALPRLSPEAASALRARATELAPPPGEHSDPFLYRRPLPDDPGEAGGWLADLLREGRPDTLPEHMESLARLVVGHGAGYRIAHGMSAGRLPGGFSAVPGLFRRDAPLADLDRLLVADPRRSLEDLLEQIAGLEPTPATALLSGPGRTSSQKLSSESLAALRDLAAAVVAESWLAPPEQLRALDPEIALDLLTLPLPRTPLHAHLAAALRRESPEQVAIRLETRFDEAVDDHPDARLRLLDAAADVGAPELVRFLVDLVVEEGEAEMGEAAIDALSRIGAPAVQFLVEEWADLDPSQQCSAFSVFARVADEQVLRFFVERADELLEENGPLFAMAATCVPDPRLAAKLHARLGELAGDEIVALHLLDRLLDASPPALEEVSAQLVRRGPRLEEIAEDFDRWEAETFLELRLRCSECGAIGEYRAGRIFLDPQLGLSEGEPAEPYVADEIPCRSCGALSDLELTPEARQLVLEAAWGDTAEGEEGGEYGEDEGNGGEDHEDARGEEEEDDREDDEESDGDEDFQEDDETEWDQESGDDELAWDDESLIDEAWGAGEEDWGEEDDEAWELGPIFFEPVELADGREVAFSEAVALYKRRLAADPADLESLLRLAGVYQRANRTGSAERLYRRALELDPHLIEASWSLTFCLLERGLPREAFAVLRAAIEPPARWRFVGIFDRARTTLRREMGELYDELRDHLGETDSPHAAAALAGFGGRKVGRNEPCPCGSGKKYKKCCGAPG